MSSILNNFGPTLCKTKVTMYSCSCFVIVCYFFLQKEQKSRFGDQKANADQVGSRFARSGRFLFFRSPTAFGFWERYYMLAKTSCHSCRWSANAFSASAIRI